MEPNSDLLQTITAVFALVISLGTAGIGWWSNYRKAKAKANQTDSEAAATITDTALELLEPYKQEVEVLQGRVTICFEKYDGLRKDYEELYVAHNTLQREYNDTLARIIKLEGQNTNLQTQVKTLISENTALKRKIIFLEGENNKFKSERHKRSEAMKNMQTTINYLSEERRRLEGELIDLRQNINGT